jgi:uncharacterized protein
MLTTFSGIYFDVFNPKLKQIKIEDIAHHLSMECRYNGACMYFYSTAEHSVLLSFSTKNLQSQKILLLHDATEAYLKDLVSDLKEHEALAFYREVEDALYLKIMEKFGLPVTLLPPRLKDFDLAIRHNEVEALFDEIPEHWIEKFKKYPPRISGLDLELWPPQAAEMAFLNRFRELFNE